MVSVSLLAQGPRRDGNWEVTMTMEMAGMPQGMSMPPIKTTQCITPEEAKDPAKSVPQRPAGRGGAANPDDCKVSDYKQDGNKVSWAMKCEGAQPMAGPAIHLRRRHLHRNDEDGHGARRPADGGHDEVQRQAPGGLHEVAGPGWRAIHGTQPR